MSHGQLQHYFASRQELLSFAMDFAAEQTAQRVARGLEALGAVPHPRDVLRLILTEMLPLHDDARATSRMNAAYVLEALHDNTIRDHTREGLRQGREQVKVIIAQAITDGEIDCHRDVNTETDRILALTGLTPLLDLEVINPGEALAAIDQHLHELFTSQGCRPGNGFRLDVHRVCRCVLERSPNHGVDEDCDGTMGGGGGS